MKKKPATQQKVDVNKQRADIPTSGSERVMLLWENIKEPFYALYTQTISRPKVGYLMRAEDLSLQKFKALKIQIDGDWIVNKSTYDLSNGCRIRFEPAVVGKNLIMGCQSLIKLNQKWVHKTWEKLFGLTSDKQPFPYFFKMPPRNVPKTNLSILVQQKLTIAFLFNHWEKERIRPKEQRYNLIELCGKDLEKERFSILKKRAGFDSEKRFQFQKIRNEPILNTESPFLQFSKMFAELEKQWKQFEKLKRSTFLK